MSAELMRKRKWAVGPSAEECSGPRDGLGQGLGSAQTRDESETGCE